jgi:hypothetical protein
MSATSAEGSASTDAGIESTLSEKQQRILGYLRDHVGDKNYFKSRLIGDELDLSAKEVGTNMSALQTDAVGIDVEKWGYSSSTTWKVTA